MITQRIKIERKIRVTLTSFGVKLDGCRVHPNPTGKIERRKALGGKQLSSVFVIVLFRSKMPSAFVYPEIVVWLVCGERTHSQTVRVAAASFLDQPSIKLQSFFD